MRDPCYADYMKLSPAILTPNVRAQLQRVLLAEPIDVVYLFGSQATGKAGPLSDVDVGILPSEMLSSDERFDLRLKLMSSLADAFDVNDVDVVDLTDRGASTLIRFNAIQPSVVIFDRHPQRRKRFEFETMRDYFDQYFYEKLMAERLIRRLAKRGLPQ